MTAPLRALSPREAAFVLQDDRLDALRARVAELERLNAEKDEFLAALSHELRTPVSAMLGWVSMLRSTRVDDDARERALATIERSAAVQARLVGDLLDVSRIVCGKLSIRREAVAVRPLVEEAVDLVLHAAEVRHIRVEMLLAADDCVVYGDAVRLQQVITNLLTNAVKFTPAGGRVVVHVSRDGSSCVVRVSDTGIGLSPDLLPHVFERFRQGARASRRDGSGLGLGLSIVKHIVELHGGEVTAESEGDGEGSAFTVRLPALVPVAQFEASDEHEVEPSADVEQPRLDGLRVLLVEDEPGTRDMIETALASFGAKVTSAATAAAAFALLPDTRPDVIISDIGLPGENGYAFIERVRSAHLGGAELTPAAALTAYAGEEDRARALAAGFQMHVAKPIDISALALTVAMLAGRSEDAP